MIRVPILTQHGVDSLLATCDAEVPGAPWDDPTCDAIYEHACGLGNDIFSEDSLPALDPPLLAGPDDAIFQNKVSYRTDATLVERWSKAGVSAMLPPAYAVESRFMVSLACFALAEYAKPRWSAVGNYRPRQHLMLDGQVFIHRAEYRRFHTSARLWWLMHLARIGTPGNGNTDMEDEILKRAKLLAFHPDFFHSLLDRPLTAANPLVLQAVLSAVLDAVNGDVEKTHTGVHLLQRETTHRWFRSINQLSAGRFMDFLDPVEVDNAVARVRPVNKAQPNGQAEMGRSRPARSDPMASTVRVLSLGGGVQSVALYLLAVTGRLSQKPDVAIFADTKWEPKHVYDTITMLREQFGEELPIEVVSYSNLYEDSFAGRIVGDGKNKKGRHCFQLPVWLRINGKNSAFKRQCTNNYKIQPVMRKTRELIGLNPRQRVPDNTRAEMWMGISTEEAQRIKPNREWWVSNYYPLIQELRWSRDQCEEYLESEYPELPVGRSACAGCPYRTTKAWLELRESDPQLFTDAVKLDEKLRKKSAKGHRAIKGEPFLHRDRLPLEEAIEAATAKADREGFLEECDGYCGI